MSGYKIDLSTVQNGNSLNLSGRRIEVIGASSASALAELCAVYANGYTRPYYDFKKGDRASSGEAFIDLKVKNTAQPGQWIEIEVTQSDDEWQYEPRDDIFIDSITNPILIDTTTPLNVVSTTIQAILNSILAIFQNRSSMKAGLTDLTNATRYSVTNATTTVVSAAANVSGAIIRTLCIDIEGGNSGYVQIGADRMWNRNGSASSPGVQPLIKDIFVPAGQQIIFSVGAGDNIVAFVEVLP